VSEQNYNPNSSRRRGSPSNKAAANVNISGAAGWVALALVLVQLLFSYGIWNRVDLVTMYYRDIKAALLAHGVNPHQHLPTESP
jgi:hypothetical protein